jgi:hypothetical protein
MSNICLNQNVSILLAVLLSGSSATLPQVLTGFLTAGWQKRSFKEVHDMSAEKERLRFATTGLWTMPPTKINLS